MNEFDNIKKKLDGYSLENYNVSQGWDKLQKRNPGKRVSLLRISVRVAAACVTIIACYWLFRGEAGEVRKQHNVAESGIEAQKQAEQALPDTVIKRIDLINEAHGLPGLQKAANNTITKNKEREPVIIQELEDAKEKVIDWDEQNVIPGKNGSTENTPVIIVQRGDLNKKPLEIVSEEQLLAMISVAKDTEPKQGKLKKFFISKGEQQEYTIEKYSSDPITVH